MELDPRRIRSDRMFEILTRKVHGKDLAALTKFMNAEEAALLNKEPFAPLDDFDILCAHPSQFLNEIHYSWLKKELENLPPLFLPGAIASLPEEKQKGLDQLMSRPPIVREPSAFAKKFYLRLLWNSVHPRHLLPKPLLPDSPLQVLLQKDKAELIAIIDLLGLYDIAEEILQIVDRKSLTNLYRCLSPLKRAFLKKCVQQKEKISISKVGLEHWNGDKTKLDRALHRRGLFRFGKALHGEHADFIWYVAHALDMGRGTVVQRYSQEKGKEKIMEILRKQCLTVVQFLEKKKQ